MLEPSTENSTECTVRTYLRITRICMCTFTAFTLDAQTVAVCVCLSPLSKKTLFRSHYRETFSPSPSSSS